MTSSVVLVTGAGGFLGSRLAAALAREPGVARVVGVDAGPPPDGAPDGWERVEFVRAGSCHHPRLARLVVDGGIDTVVHAGIDPPAPGGHPPSTGTDVVGGLHLLAACQRSPHLRRLVVRSTAAVYGSSSRDPALFVEEDAGPTAAGDGAPPDGVAGGRNGATPAGRSVRGGFARAAVELECHVRAFSRRRPDVSVTVLRLANLVGPGAPAGLVRYFGLPAVPTVWGHDPRLQFLHERDAVEVFRRAVLDRGPTGPGLYGPQRTVNVAGSGVLLLSQAIRRAGRVPVPVPGLAGTLLTALAHRARPAGRHGDHSGDHCDEHGGNHGADQSGEHSGDHGGDLDAQLHPERTGLLTFDGIMDTGRLLREFGYRPRYTSGQAFDDFVCGRGRPGDGTGHG